MKNLLLLGYLFFAGFYCMAQNTGIGTTTPSEKLDVNGNLNVQGQIKVAGQQGNSGEVLMKDGSNNPIWASMGSGFDTLVVYDTDASPGGSLSTQWNVPAGVTRVFVEVWGAGGGGGYLFSGGAGGYISALISTLDASALSVIVGSGGKVATNAADAGTGFSSSVSYGSLIYTAEGGKGSFSGTTNTPNSPDGGGFTGTGVGGFFGLKGQAGNGIRMNYGMLSSTVYFEELSFAKGGDAPLYPGSGPLGGYQMFHRPAGTLIISNYGQAEGTHPGCGGASDFTYGYKGSNGRVIIRWKK